MNADVVPIREQADIDDGLRELLRLDPRLQAVAQASGPLPLRLNQPGYQGLAHIIVSQMVSRQSADAIWGRIATACGTVDADRFLALAPDVLAGLGLSRAKLACLQGVARSAVSGNLDLLSVATLPAEEAMTQLVALPGVGPWTAEVYLMFCGGHPDIFPAGDVALRAAVGDAFLLETRPDIPAVRAISEQWRPWRSVAARLFWAYYAARRGRNALPAQES